MCHTCSVEYTVSHYQVDNDKNSTHMANRLVLESSVRLFMRFVSRTSFQCLTPCLHKIESCQYDFIPLKIPSPLPWNPRVIFRTTCCSCSICDFVTGFRLIGIHFLRVSTFSVTMSNYILFPTHIYATAIAHYLPLLNVS